MSEIDVINDYQNIVKRLQQECTEKTDAIIFLGEQLYRYKQAIDDIKEIAEKRNYLDYNECLDDILQKISEREVQK